MVNLIPICLAAILASKGLAALVGGVAGWLYWLHVQAKREQSSPERQRDRLRQKYWGQL
jgi:hypothetical protein